MYYGQDMDKSSVTDMDCDRAMGYRMNSDRVVLASPDNIINIAQFINSASIGGYYARDESTEQTEQKTTAPLQTANVEAVFIPVSTEKAIVMLQATEDIEKGDQLLLEYGVQYWLTRNANGERVFIPDEILSERINNMGEKEFRVRWRYFNDYSWESWENLKDCQVMDAYEAKLSQNNTHT